MKTKILTGCLLLTLSGATYADGDNAITSNDVAHMTNAPVINSVGQNSTVQVNQNDHEQVEDLKCPLPTISVVASYNEQGADNNYNNYRTEGEGANVFAGFSAPVGGKVKCGDLFKAKMVIVENNILSAKILNCDKWRNMGYTLNRQELFRLKLINKEQNKSLQFCEYVTNLNTTHPKHYEQQIAALKNENKLLQQKATPVKVDKKPTLKYYREYRIRFKDWVSGCNKGCNDEYKFIKEYLDYITSNSTKDVKIYAEPYGKEGKVSVYVRGSWNTWTEAEMERQRYVVAGLPVKIVGVRGSEVYE